MKGSQKSTWIASSFNDFEEIKEPSERGKKRRRHCEQETASAALPKSSSRSASASQSMVVSQLWADKYTPTSVADLAVHKKKVADLQGWFEFSLRPKSHFKHAPILLLTGPTGAGKTATVNALARDMSIEVQEWINPVEQSFSGFCDDWDGGGNQRQYSSLRRSNETQSALFQDFLLRANKYNKLQIFGDAAMNKKVILVEDFPNLFFRDARKFHDILREYLKKGHCPLIFIISDSAGGDSNERLLFPKDIQAELNVSNISFNPINMSSMVKVLTRIASQEASKKGKASSVPNKQTLEALYDSSAGDIRGAINALQFACHKGTGTRDLEQAFKGAATLKKSTSKKGSTLQKTLISKSRVKSKGKKAKTSPDEREESLASIGGRDTSLFLFRALGKILYCKRGDKRDFPEHRELPEAVAHLNRDPLLVNPEEVLEKSHLSGDFFTAFLQQNYLDFYSDIEDVVEASEYISDSDYLTVDWVSRADMREYAASLSSRALMFCNKARASSCGGGSSGLGFKPLHKPQWFSVMKKTRENKEGARALFRKCCQTPVELLTQYLPYLVKVNPKHNIAGQNAYLEEVIGWHSSKFRRQYAERLDEQDIELDAESEEPSQHLPESADSNCTTAEDSILLQEDPEIVIEDFDDD